MPTSSDSERQPDGTGSQSDAGFADEMETLDALENPDKLPPAVSTAEFNQQNSQWYSVFAQCMNQKGWENVHVVNAGTPNVGLMLNAPEGQESVYNADTRQCSIEAGPEPQAPVVTREFAQHEYEVAVQMAECLRQHGFTISEAPSAETYIDDVLNSRPPWIPVSELHSNGNNLDRPITEIYELCPVE